MVDRLERAFGALSRIGTGRALTSWISETESNLSGVAREQLDDWINTSEVLEPALDAALFIKSMVGQINVAVHAVGILVSLPYLLRPGEVVEHLSLGAGNTGRGHDLETDRQIGEFKFIEWRGGAESIRQNSLFVDLFNLAASQTTKERNLYVVDKTHPMRFLENRRAIKSVLSKHAHEAARFSSAYGDRFTTVRDYYDSVRDLVNVVDLRDYVPQLRTIAGDT